MTAYHAITVHASRSASYFKKPRATVHAAFRPVRVLLYRASFPFFERSFDMHTFSMNGAWSRGRAALRARLTLRGPRAYADTHDVALSLLERGGCDTQAALASKEGSAAGSRLSALDLGAGRG